MPLYNLRTYSLGSPTLVATAVSFTAELFRQCIFLRSRAEDAHEMYSRGSIAGDAAIIESEISPTPPLIFTGGVKKCEIWHRFQRGSTLSGRGLKTQHDV